MFEVKSIGNENNASVLLIKFQEAAEQAERIASELRRFQKNIICSSEEQTMDVHVIICLPNISQKTLENAIGSEKLRNLTVLCEEDIIDQNRFQQYWDAILVKNGSNNFFQSSPTFKVLVTLLCGLRSATNDVKAISQQHNVVELYNKLNEQTVAKAYYESKQQQKKARWEIKMDENSERQPLLLLPEQINILEDESKNIIVYGAPGTGKTLLLMIKALQWSKEDGEGRVVLEAKKALIPLYQRFFDAHKDEMERKPIVLELGYGRIKNEEDYLSDEDSGLNKTKIKFLTDRAKAKGRNFIALTGAITPWELSNYENSFTNEYSELAAKYSIHPLWTVLRGTMEIVNYWNRELQLPKLTIGHSISGCAVDDRNAKLPNTQQVLKCILEKVQTILNGTSKNGEQHKNTVAVICTDRVECTELQRILKDNNISVRSVDENDNPNASVVVDWHNNVLSYEWQTVLVVSLYYPTEFNPRFLPLAASRTICRLIIIGRDAMTAVNGVTEKYPNTDLSSIPYSNFEKSVMKLSQKLGRTDDLQ